MSAISREARFEREDVVARKPFKPARSVGEDIVALTAELCAFNTGVVADDNAALFARLGRELPLTLHRYPSGDTFNGWTVPDRTRVLRATISRGGKVMYDAAVHPLGVAMNSRSFRGTLTLDELRSHLVTHPTLDHALVFHCAWQYRPWDSDWAISMPASLARTLQPGEYQVCIDTDRSPGEMLVGECVLPGEHEQTFVFAAHTCHPGQANDDMAGVALLARMFQWLANRERKYTYKLVLGPEHLGTVFFLRDHTAEELSRYVGGAFCEMPGSAACIKIASSYLGEQTIDHAFRAAANELEAAHVCVPWRQGAGNDETVWEAPGYEVPFVEVSRAHSLFNPFPEYHTSDDTAAALDAGHVEQMFELFKGAVEVLERDVRPRRRFSGLMCLSNPKYNLYFERPDPAIDKKLALQSERWGRFNDHVQRLLDGQMTAMEIALTHDLPFGAVRDYLERMAAKGLVTLEPSVVPCRAVSHVACGCDGGAL